MWRSREQKATLCILTRKFKFWTYCYEMFISIFRFGERMSDVKKDNDKRTARLQIDRTAANGLVSSNNKFVSSRKHMLVNRTSASANNFPSSSTSMTNISSTANSNPELHRYNHSQNPHNRPPPNGLLPERHPLFDRSKHKKHNPEIMKRTLRYVIDRIDQSHEIHRIDIMA